MKDNRQAPLDGPAYPAKIVSLPANLLQASIAAAAIAAARCGLVLGYAFLGNDPQFWDYLFGKNLLLCVALATFLVALFFWWLLVIGRTNGLRGAGAGFLTGLVSHPVTWLFFNGQWAWAFWSLLLFGVFTVPTTTITGALLGILMSGNEENNSDENYKI